MSSPLAPTGTENVSSSLVPAAPETRRSGARRYRVYLYVAAALVLISAVRLFTGVDGLTSDGVVNAALGLAVPIGMAGLGGLWAERAGVVNIGLEGMMILGTWGAGWAGYQHGPWLGVLAAVAFGAIGGLVHAVATVTFRVDHIVSGVAINILGLGATQFLSNVAFNGADGGGGTQSPPIPALPRLSVPGIGGPLSTLEDKGWFLLSDLAGILRGVLVDVSSLTVIAVALLVGSFYVLWRTPFGLRLRMCGENPTAAETLGVPVYRMKYAAVVASGAFAGLGGAYLAIVAAGIYREGQTGGRGYIGLAAMIFGNWRPGGLAGGALLFGYTDAIQLRNTDVRPLLLVLGALLLVLAAVAVRAVLRARVVLGVLGAVVVVELALLVLDLAAVVDLDRRLAVYVPVRLLGLAALVALLVPVLRRAVGVRALLTAVAATVVGGSYFLISAIPPQFTSATPYVATLLVLALASQRLRAPAAAGLRYAKGEGR